MTFYVIIDIYVIIMNFKKHDFCGCLDQLSENVAKLVFSFHTKS